MFLERRQFQRVFYGEPVRYKLIDSREEAYFQGALGRDVSESGIRFVTDRFVPLNSRLMMEMCFPPSLKPVKVVARPAWIREIIRQEQFEIGNCFVEISEEDRCRIRNFVTSTPG